MQNDKKEVTIYDFAKELNVSPSTVSRALQKRPTGNVATRKRIRELAQVMGYRSNHVASSLRRQRTQTIGVIIPLFDSSLMSTIVAGMEDIATRAGFNLIVSHSAEQVMKEKNNAATMFANRVDGLLVSMAFDAVDIQHFDIFSQKKTPILFFDRVPNSDQYTRVLIDNSKAAREATLHLIEQGCQRIAHITAPSRRNVYLDRLQGYKEALAAANIPFDERLLIYTPLNFDAGIEAAALIQKIKPLPDGLFVANDNCAVSCMTALKEKGFRIPEDIAFVGFNNGPIARVTAPSLTTINYPGYEMGKVAMQRMLDELKEDSASHISNTLVLQADLIVRNSSLKSKSSLPVSK